jgi:hypothetical protein
MFSHLMRRYSTGCEDASAVIESLLFEIRDRDRRPSRSPDRRSSATIFLLDEGSKAVCRGPKHLGFESNRGMEPITFSSSLRKSRPVDVEFSDTFRSVESELSQCQGISRGNIPTSPGRPIVNRENIRLSTRKLPMVGSHSRRINRRPLNSNGCSRPKIATVGASDRGNLGTGTDIDCYAARLPQTSDCPMHSVEGSTEITHRAAHPPRRNEIIGRAAQRASSHHIHE